MTFKSLSTKVISSSLVTAALSLLAGCNAQDIASLESALQQATSSTTASTPSPSASPTTASVPSCGYTASYTYDLGPDININKNFESFNVQVTENIIQSSAVDCPENVMIPAAGDWKSAFAYAVTNQQGEVNIYASRFGAPITLTPATAADFVATNSITLTDAEPQISNGNETELFDNGTLNSSSGVSSNATLIVQVTYAYAAAPNQD